MKNVVMYESSTITSNFLCRLLRNRSIQEIFKNIDFRFWGKQCGFLQLHFFQIWEHHTLEKVHQNLWIALLVLRIAFVSKFCYHWIVTAFFFKTLRFTNFRPMNQILILQHRIWSKKPWKCLTLCGRHRWWSIFNSLHSLFMRWPRSDGIFYESRNISFITEPTY